MDFDKIEANNVVGFCHAATNSSIATMLLLRIIHWSKYAKREFGGHRWVVKKAVEWHAELHITSKQYDNAISKLRKAGVVIAEAHLYKDRLCSHIRLDPKFREALNTVVREMVPSSEVCLDDPKKGCTYKKENLDINLDNNLVAHPDKPGSPETPNPVTEVFSGEEKMEEKMDPVALQKAKDKLNPKKPKAPPKLMEVIYEWRERAGEVTGKFQAEFSPKDIGKMKMFIAGGPPGFDPRDTIRNVIKDWFGFVDEVKSQKGFKQVPSEPEFGFVFLNKNIAYNFKVATGKTVPLVKSEPSSDPFGGLQKFKGYKK